MANKTLNIPSFFLSLPPRSSTRPSYLGRGLPLDLRPQVRWPRGVADSAPLNNKLRQPVRYHSTGRDCQIVSAKLPPDTTSTAVVWTWGQTPNYSAGVRISSATRVMTAIPPHLTDVNVGGLMLGEGESTKTGEHMLSYSTGNVNVQYALHLLSLPLGPWSKGQG